MPYFDPKYFKKKSKVNRVVTRKLKNKFIAWELGKEYYEVIAIMDMVVFHMMVDG